MLLGLGENTWWGSPVDRVEGIILAKRCGFDAYGIFTQDMSPSLRRRMREALREVELPVTSALVVVTSISDWNADVRRFTVQWLKQQLEICYDFGSNTLILVPGEYVWEGKEIKPEVQYQWAVDSLRDVGDHAKSLGIDLAIESNTPTHNMVRNIADLVRIIRDTEHSSVKANVDVVNMYVLGDRPGALRQLKDKIANVHFSDTPRGKYLHYPPGRGVVPLRKDLMTLKSIGFEGTIEVELEGIPNPEQTKDWVGEAYEAGSSMMDELGVRNTS